jgi:hypothetical protein
VQGAPIVYENPTRPDLPSYGHVLVPVENDGLGPALNVRGEIQLPRGRGAVELPREAVGVRRRTVVTFIREEGVFDLHGGERFSGRLLYDDIAGITYETKFEYDSGRSA